MNWKKLASLGVVAMMSLSILGCGSDTASNDKAASSSSLSGSITGSGSSALLPLAKDAAYRRVNQVLPCFCKYFFSVY